MYRMFDGVIACDFPLPGIPEAESSRADIQVRLGSGTPDEDRYECLHNWCEGDDELILSCARRLGEADVPQYLLRFPDLADFEIRGHIITCFPESECREDSLRHLLLDQVIPRLWANMGHLVLHASAVRLTDGRVVAFIGESGWGKSTLAGALAARGHTLISDDSICLSAGENGVQLIPSYTGLRLNDDSIGELGMLDREWETVSHYSDKRRFEPEGIGGLSSHHLDTLFLLKEPSNADVLSILTVSGAELVATLIKRSFLLDIRDWHSAARQMGEASAVLRAVQSVQTLSYPRDYRQLPNLCEALETGGWQ